MSLLLWLVFGALAGLACHPGDGRESTRWPARQPAVGHCRRGGGWVPSILAGIGHGYRVLLVGVDCGGGRSLRMHFSGKPDSWPGIKPPARDAPPRGAKVVFAALVRNKPPRRQSPRIRTKVGEAAAPPTPPQGVFDSLRRVARLFLLEKGTRQGAGLQSIAACAMLRRRFLPSATQEAPPLIRFLLMRKRITHAEKEILRYDQANRLPCLDPDPVPELLHRPGG